ncbi:uncharacterized protein EDB91DRAFT_163388 [Suillus paluster]|uniref:uncharacterized protein n=1 Tax=Suillus paluster TaxID=48578 RepID=UPI001B87ED54|nr:uncharacterized protein EDB91DRAFT_163388 [Suillus paluster]KAG1723532.1 hypothetical protein EDB91DRAFT_163388 [Suillus paluster]
MHDLLTPETFQAHVSLLGSEDAACKSIQNMWDNTCPHSVIDLCLKPLRNSDDDDVRVHQLFTEYSVRIWGADLECTLHYRFDFVDPCTGHPVNPSSERGMYFAASTFSRMLRTWFPLVQPGKRIPRQDTRRTCTCIQKARDFALFLLKDVNSGTHSR